MSKGIVLVAVNWFKVPAALAGLPDFGGGIVIDANNSIEAPLFKPAELNGRLSSEVFAGLVPGARVVKAFNHLQPHLLSGDPRAEGGHRVLFYSGDDAGSKAEIGALIDRLGFFGIDLGPISVGGRLVQSPADHSPPQFGSLRLTISLSMGRSGISESRMLAAALANERSENHGAPET